MYVYIYIDLCQKLVVKHLDFLLFHRPEDAG
jgi:predicted oxidoreductase